MGLYADVKERGEVREEKRTVSLQPAYAREPINSVSKWVVSLLTIIRVG